MSITISKKPHKVEQGFVAKKFAYSDTFELHLHIVLHELPTAENNLLHLSTEGHPDLLMIDIVPGTLCVRATINSITPLDRGGEGVCVSVKGEGASEALSGLNNEDIVVVRLESGHLNLALNGISIDRATLDLVEMGPEKVTAYLSSPSCAPANATLNHVSFNPAKSKAHAQHVESDKVNFNIPLKQQELIDQVAAELEKSKQWAKFDGFFGVFLMINSILVGVQTQLTAADAGVDPTVWVLIDTLFLGIFLVEFALRLCMMGRQWYKILPHDGWAMFDATVITISVLESFVLNNIELPFPIGVLRLFRLLKLAKMVRLVRAFRQLGMLVEGVVNAMETLTWTGALLSIFLYVAGVMMVKLCKWGLTSIDDPLKRAHLNKFSDVLTSMWQILGMCTFDDWSAPLHNFAFEVGGVLGLLLTVLLLMIVICGGLGIFNLVVGVLCHTAHELDKKLKGLKGAEHLMEQKRVMTEFRDCLKNYGDRPLFKSDKFITQPEVLEAAQEDEEIMRCCEILELSTEELITLTERFSEHGQIEISGFVDAACLVVLQRFFASLGAGDFILTKGSSIPPIDMLFFSRGLREVHLHLEQVTGSVKAVMTLCRDCLQKLRDRAHAARTLIMHTKKLINIDYKPVPEHILRKQKSKLNSQISAKYFDTMYTEALSLTIIVGLDLMSGLAIILNGAFIGLQAYKRDDVSMEFPLLVVDLLFTVIFIIEFVLRAMHLADVQHDPELGDEKSIDRFLRCKKNMLWGVVPRCPERGGWRQTCHMIPQMLRKASYFFDFIVISASFADCFILFWLRRTGVTNLDAGMIGILRVFRLVRLVKLLRVFKAFPMLQIFSEALFSSGWLLFWAVMLLTIPIYAFSIATIKTVGDDPELHAGVSAKYFSSVAKCMLTGWQLVTFDDSDVILWPLLETYPGVIPFWLIFHCLLAFGVMKIIVGVFCESAVQVVQSILADQERKKLVSFLDTMEELKTLIVENTDDEMLTRQMVLDCIELMKFKQSLEVGEHAAYSNQQKHKRDHKNDLNEVIKHEIEKREKEKYGDKSEHELLSQGSLSLHRRKDLDQRRLTKLKTYRYILLERMYAIWEKSEIPVEFVLSIFDKVDYDCEHKVHIDMFVHAALENKEDMSKLDVFASGLSLRHCRHLRAKVFNIIHQVHASLGLLIYKMNTVVMRRPYNWWEESELKERSVSEAHDHAEIKVDLSNLDEVAQHALDELCSWNGTGNLPHLRSRLEVTPGTGKVCVGGDFCMGEETIFKKELAPGDLIIFQTEKTNMVTQETFKMDGVVTVRSMVSHTGCKLESRSEVTMKEFGPFYIGRRHQEKVRMEKHFAKKGANESPMASPRGDLSPRTSQSMFDWEVNTRQRKTQDLDKLEEENSQLEIEKEQCIEELIHESEKFHLEIHFLVWMALTKGLLKPRKSVKELD